MKSVILYGAGVLAEKYYTKYRNEYNIEFIIDQKEISFHGIKVYKFEDIKMNLKNKKIIVTANESNYNAIKKLLESVGLIENKNFQWIYHYQKKKAVVYGNCHMGPIVDYLERQPEFATQYYIVYYRIGDSNGKEFPSGVELSNCDLFITQNIRENNSRKVPGYKSLMKYINTYTKTIIVPNFYGINLFFPQLNQINKENIVNKHINNKNSISINNYEIIDALSCYSDTNIDELLNEGKSKEEIKKTIQDDLFYNHTMIKEKFNREILKIKEREQDCSFSVSEWIMDNYQDKLLFYEPHHPTNELLFQMAKLCMKLLKMEVIEELKPQGGMDAREVFIYNSVRKALGLKFRQKYIRNNMRYGSLDDVPMDENRYIDYYIKWMNEE